MIALASIERDMELEEQIEQNLSGSLVRYLFETLSGIEKDCSSTLASKRLRGCESIFGCV